VVFVPVALLLLLLAGCALQPARADGPRWFPLEAGRRWTYEVEIEDAFPGPTPARARRSRRVATLVREVMEHGPSPSGDGRWIELRAARAERAPEARGASLARTWLALDGAAVREMARAEGESAERVLHAEPLLVLPADPVSARRWRVGRLPLGESSLELWAEVAGTESVRTPAGIFEDCLRIHTRGSSEHGSVEGWEWLAPGVGPVRQVLERALVAVDDAGRRSERRQREVRTLREHRR
jgi:hypothetical protein